MLLQKTHKIKSIGIHSLFWVLALLFFLFYYKRYSEINIYTISAAFGHLIIAMGTVYTFNYYLIPTFLIKGLNKKFIFFSIIALVLFIYLQFILTAGILIKLLYTDRTLFPSMLDALVLMVNLFFIVLIGISVKLFKRWSQKEKQEQELQKEKVEAELKMLKTQINPHFLFNTLNSIYVLAMKNSENTANTVLKLSDILDYILYKNNADRVLLSEELNIIKNYIELEKIRYGERVTIKIIEQVEDKSIVIPPMLIIPFIENAFKHGVAKTIDQAWINFTVTQDADKLHIEIANSKKAVAQKQENGGIGLENVKRRLELIYGKKSELDIVENNITFNVSLTINFKND